MKQRTGCIALLLLMISSTTHSADTAGTDLHTLMRALATAPHPNLSYTETRESAFLDVPLVSHGLLRLTDDGTLVKEKTQPFLERSRIDHSHLHLETEQGSRSIVLAEVPALHALSQGLRALFQGDEESMDRLFHVQFEANGEDWRLRLTPRDQALGGVVEQIRVAGSGARITRVHTLERDGDSALLELEPGGQ